jgi:hypothetical protein
LFHWQEEAIQVCGVHIINDGWTIFRELESFIREN